MDENIYNMAPEEQAMLDFQAENERIELSNRVSEIEENGLYLRNLLNHMNDKLFLPAAKSVMPAITLAVSTAGAIGTVALGALYLLMKFK